MTKQGLFRRRRGGHGGGALPDCRRTADANLIRAPCTVIAAPMGCGTPAGQWSGGGAFSPSSQQGPNDANRGISPCGGKANGIAPAMRRRGRNHGNFGCRAKTSRKSSRQFFGGFRIFFSCFCFFGFRSFRCSDFRIQGSNLCLILLIQHDRNIRQIIFDEIAHDFWRNPCAHLGTRKRTLQEIFPYCP